MTPHWRTSGQWHPGVRGVSACEESALACFGGLDTLQDIAANVERDRSSLKRFTSNRSVMVISCGCGLMSAKEQNFVSEYCL